MRFLILDSRYSLSVDGWYAKHPGLHKLTYDDQVASFRSSLIGETNSQAKALRELGHEADDVIFNLMPAQAAWAREHGFLVNDSPRWGLRLRRGLVPWPARRTDSQWLATVLLRQIEEYRPDVIHLSAMDVLEPALIREIRLRCRFMVGQIAARLATERAQLGYDLIVSSLPNFVERFQNAGIEAEWLPLAFDPSPLSIVGPQDRKVSVSFVGSVFDVHPTRIPLIETIGENTAIDVWSADAGRLPTGRYGRVRKHPGVWGADMYRVLASSRQTVNVHAFTEDIPPIDANNFRLFEATGMGALLITDRLRTLGELFDVGREVVGFGSPAECAELVSYYVDHPDEAASIAAAGQARTLRDHTWMDRMEREVAMIRQRM